MKITPLKAFHDNYIWLIENEGETVCVDPGQAKPVLAALHSKHKNLDAIWLTHRHADHIGGVNELKQAFPQVRIYGPAGVHGVTEAVGEASEIISSLGTVTVWAVPGHTREHIAFLMHDRVGQLHVFCGDTLFSAGCGRVFDGTMVDLIQSLQRFSDLPADSLFYPAHEYTEANLRFAAAVEPDNIAIVEALRQAKHIPTLPVTLAHERTVNPFLRFQQPALRQYIAVQRHIAQDNDLAVFAALRQWKNEW